MTGESELDMDKACFDVKDWLTTSGGKLCGRRACSSSSWRSSGYGLLKES